MRRVLHYQLRNHAGWRYAACGRAIKPVRTVTDSDRVTCCDCVEWLAEGVEVRLVLAQANEALHSRFGQGFGDG